ncbi:hypothetical protein GIB67_004383 [Kingdonia uniflora]|uniref:Uncharacterized protein n=1 Tax=Kingdonia uniflora TaxID=39325 RepID=A0A7J7MRA9_9MAGN|nr:hypothetical protein GIB67_004383 [Kingdonia uniflora]
MVDAMVTFFTQRLDYLLKHETECFTGLEEQVQWFKTVLNETGPMFNDVVEHDEAARSLLRELGDIVHNMDNLMDEVVIKMESVSGSDRELLVTSFGIEMEKVNVRLAENKGKASQLDFLIMAKEATSIDETSSSSSSLSFGLCFGKLPYYLRYCLMYCCIFPENYWIPKGRLARLLVAEGLVQEIPGVTMEDVAKENIQKLVDICMLLRVQHRGSGTKLVIPSPYREMLLRALQNKFFFALNNEDPSSIPNDARRVLINSDPKNIPSNLGNLLIRSLLMFGIKDISEVEFDRIRPVFHGAKFLRVLDLEDVKFKNIPDEVGGLVHLKYLGLKNTNVDGLPESLGNLRNLQTLDIRRNGNISALSRAILKLLQLKYLKMFKDVDVSGLKVPEGIGRLKNLHTLTGIYAGDGTAEELRSLKDLKRLGVMELGEEHASAFCDSITEIRGLLSLSLEAKNSCFKRKLPNMEQFSPPPLLQKLQLEGELENIPSWFPLLKNLTKLRLGFTHLSENPSLVLQYLPNLKHLSLWHAYDGKQIGKEFCEAGRFPKLEVLSIASHVLEEWTELVEGSFPSLNFLHIHNCVRLRMLPEGLQHVTTLKQLDLLPLLDDHEERLIPDGGEENYKIKNIPTVNYIKNSMVASLRNP